MCDNLSATRITVNNASTTTTITPGAFGVYTGCSFSIKDHADNQSNWLSLDTFVYGLGTDAICSHPELTVSQSECEALASIYDSTNGDSWTSNTNW